MKVFISWSGELSGKFAKKLTEWLPSVLQFVEPYFTPSDIEKGARWNSEIAKQLEKSQLGIFCMTPESLKSPWVMFEAGAISKVVNDARVCPILFGLRNNDVTGPLSQFQSTEFNKDDMFRLVETINNTSGERKLRSNTLETVFNKWWLDLEEQIEEAQSKHTEETDEEIREDREILEEILSLCRLTAIRSKPEKEQKKRGELESYGRDFRDLIPPNSTVTIAPKPPPQTSEDFLEQLLKIMEDRGKKREDDPPESEG